MKESSVECERSLDDSESSKVSVQLERKESRGMRLSPDLKINKGGGCEEEAVNTGLGDREPTASLFNKAENYDGLSGVYLGPSRSLEKYDIEYLNEEFVETEKEVQDSYRPPSPLSLDSFSGIYIGPEEKRNKEAAMRRMSLDLIDSINQPSDFDVAGDQSLVGRSLEAVSDTRQCKSVCALPIVEKKKKKRGRFFFTTQQSSDEEKQERRGIERSKTLCLRMFKKSFNITD